MSDRGWQLPGFAVEELIGYGATGEVWRAREVATGERVALKRLRSGAADAVRIRREAALLADVTGPHLVRLRRVVADGDATVLVLDHPAGGSLAALLRVRARLSGAEVVTVAVPLAETLAQVHARGLVHGDVTPANVLFAADGRPLLGDLGVDRLVGVPAGCGDGEEEYADPAVPAGRRPDARSDVYGLAAVAFAALAGRAPGAGAVDLAAVPGEVPPALVRAVSLGLDPDPAARPSAAELAALVRGSGAPAPVRLPRAEARPATVPAPLPVTHRRGFRSRLPVRLVAALAVAAGLAVAVTAGRAWSDRSRPTAGHLAPPAAPDPAPPTPAGAWRDVLAGLDAARARAFAALDGASLALVYAPGSLPLRRDLATLRRLAARRERPVGLRADLVSVTVVARVPGSLTLRVVDVLPAYDLVDARGAVVRHEPGRGPRAFRIVLTDGGSGWRISAETAA